MKGKYEFSGIISVTINNSTRKAWYVNNLFGELLRELIIYLRSSGKKENLYMEISVWSRFTEKIVQTGSSFFHNPKPGQIIQIT